MKLIELLKDIQVLESAIDLNMEVKDIKYDSRAVEPGDVFVAIVGFETDGHKYIASAMEKGAAAVVCQMRPDEGVPFVRVSNSRRALAMMS